MLHILGDQLGLLQSARAAWAAHENVGPAPVAERAYDVCRSDQIAVFVDEKSITKEKIAIAALGRKLVERVYHRAHGRQERGIICGSFRCSGGRSRAGDDKRSKR